MKQPIMKFETLEEAVECMNWWKHRLFLDDWIIHVKIIPYAESPLDSIYMGHSEADHVNNGAMIYLASQDTLPKDCIMTLCDEHVLVHELLHIRYPSIVDSSSYTSAFMDMEEHRQLERMAKTLIMVKYDLPFEWFDVSLRERVEKEARNEKTVDSICEEIVKHEKALKSLRKELNLSYELPEERGRIALGKP